ncbi:MAG: hybrid sensor histidine kinase/response regulator [Candidatus Melainabacteria bacterium]|nr:hybrid sensor histidine kinase/response regulator [Candidatus Melainabacteria bacterium]
MSTQTARMSRTTQCIRLLLIEDNPDDAAFIEEVLKLQDTYATVDVAVVGKLRDGLSCLARRNFDVVLLDLSLPDASSTNSVTRVLAQSPQAPIIVLTGLDDRDTALDALKKGAQDYIIKDSISGDLLIRAIRYAVERRRAESRARVKAAVEREDLIFTLANDLRVPHIGAMRAFDLLVAEALGPLNQEQKNLLGKVKQSSHEVLHMLSNLVHLYRIEQSGQKILALPTDLNRLIEQIIEDWSYAASENGIKVEVHSDLAEPVLLDGKAFKKAMSNLIHNAIKFSFPNGIVSVTSRCEGNWLYLSVKDNGKGMSSHDQEKLFQRFWNDNDTMRHSNGSGVGLYVCRQIVEAHGGDITCISEEGKGTTVTVKMLKAGCTSS